MLWCSLNRLHKITLHCKKEAYQKRQFLAAEEVRAITARAFSDYSRPLDMVPYFKYLGIVLPVADDDWSAVIHNLAKA